MKIYQIIYIIIFSTLINAYSQERNISNPPNMAFVVYVFDSSSRAPLQNARVTFRKNGAEIETEITNGAGKAIFQDIYRGKYNITVYLDGYSSFVDSISIDESASSFSVGLKEYSTQEIDITDKKNVAVSDFDNKTGNQVFESEGYHGAPTDRMTNIIQEHLMGATRAPTGEVHIAGQHAEFTYYVDGVPIPLGVFGGLNEIVDPKVIDRITFLTGGFPAEYGGQMSAVMDILNHVPKGRFHLDFSSYIGSYLVFNGAKPFSTGTEVPSGQSSSVAGDTLGGRVGPLRTINSNGQSLSLSNHMGNFAFYVSGSRQETDRRIDQPTATLFNDRGTDYFLYGKFDLLLNKNDYITSNLNYSSTETQVPFDINEQGYAPDNQNTTNSYQTLSYYHTISSKQNKLSNLFIGMYARQGSLLYTPSSVSPATFQFAGDSALYALTEDRSFNTYGIRSKYDFRLTSEFKSYVGFNFSITNGAEHFTSRDSAGATGPEVLTDFKGSDFGVFAQSEWKPVKMFKLDLGLRYDQQISPGAGLERMVSPRIKLNFYPDETTTAYLYYGKHFMPNNIEGLRSLASNVSSSDIPTVAEKDDFYEAVYLKAFRFGLDAKVGLFYKYSSPGVDDQTVGSSAVKTPVNIATVKSTGIELGLSYTHPTIPLTSYVNASVIHAYGSGAVTGGFLDISNDGAATDLDHDQRLSIVAGINYQPKKWFVNMTAIYGSGLTNGNPNGSAYQTGLFDFNSGAHVPQSIIFNIGAGYTFYLYKSSAIEPSIYISNLFDNSYLLKGAYFSAASYGERRNVVLKFALHI